MILVFGGAFQGKLDFIKRELKIKDDVSVCRCTEDAPLDLSADIICDMEQYFLALVREGREPSEVLSDCRDSLKDKVVIINDISQGIVPVDDRLRAWREATGRAMLYLSAEAEKVYRVFCGLGQRLK